ncbi:MAG: hypothetical protein AAF721_41625 [Myxococcota bacterium]
MQTDSRGLGRWRAQVRAAIATLLLVACAPLSGELELEEVAPPASAPLTIVPLEPPAESTEPRPCVAQKTDGVFAGPHGGPLPLPPDQLGRRLAVDREWLRSVDNDNERYHHTVDVPLVAPGRWYYLRVGEVVWYATASNSAESTRRRRVSFYIDRELADRVACTRGIVRGDRVPMRAPAAAISAPPRVQLGEAIPITVDLSNDGEAPIVAALGDPNAHGRDWAFTLQVTRDDESVRLPRPEGRSGRSHRFEPGDSLAIRTDLHAWVPVEPRRRDQAGRSADRS